MSNFIILGLVALISGICASLGIGGGFILLIYLTVFLNMQPMEAQLLNLLFFIPVAFISVIIHLKNHFVQPKVVIPCIIFGILGVLAGSIVAVFLKDAGVSKLFGLLIIFVGIKEFFSWQKNTKDNK